MGTDWGGLAALAGVQGVHYSLRFFGLWAAAYRDLWVERADWLSD